MPTVRHERAVAAWSAGGCGVQNRVQHGLQPPTPDVFYMQLTWQNSHADSAEIKATVEALSQVTIFLYCTSGQPASSSVCQTLFALLPPEDVPSVAEEECKFWDCSYYCIRLNL